MTALPAPTTGVHARDAQAGGARVEGVARLFEARQRTVALLAPLSRADLTAQHSPLQSPLVWDLAHIGWYEEYWLLRRLAGAKPSAGRFDDVYDAFRHGRGERGQLDLLDPDRAWAYVTDVREQVLTALDLLPWETDELLVGAFALGLVSQHEEQHCETMLQTLLLRHGGYPAAPAPPAGRSMPLAEAVVPGGPFPLGTSDEPLAYDNERPRHEADVPTFAIDTVPVTNRAFLDFVADGGYRARDLWRCDGWRLVVDEQLAAPLQWRRDGSTWRRVRFDAIEELPLDEPVQHVSWYEADAYARWAGRRLPSEVEWEKAASWDPVGRTKRRFPWGDRFEPGRANLGQRHLQPAAVGAYPGGASAYGVEQLAGDVWEWTSSSFSGYPGFRAFPYREYSEVFFGSEYRVLRGGSWATSPSVARTTFRNWDYPIRRQIVAGFRCARDV